MQNPLISHTAITETKPCHDCQGSPQSYDGGSWSTCSTCGGSGTYERFIKWEAVYFNDVVKILMSDFSLDDEDSFRHHVDVGLTKLFTTYKLVRR